MIEHLPDVIDGGAGDGDVAARDAGLGADTAGDPAAVAKQRVQQRADAVVAHGLLVGLLDLAGDLPLADDHAVETGGDAEQVPHGLGLTMDVQMRANGGERQTVEVGEKLGDASASSSRGTIAGSSCTQPRYSSTRLQVLRMTASQSKPAAQARCAREPAVRP